MSDASTDDAISAEARRVLAGAIREDLGLASEDLRFGLHVARNQLMRGAKQAALRTYAALVLCEPMNAEFQAGLANCASQLGDHHLALQAASAVIALDPRNALGYYLSGHACLALGHRDEAREDLLDAVSFGRAAKEAKIVVESEKLLSQLAALAG
jgi:Flp pilus assembly protein TadD